MTDDANVAATWPRGGLEAAGFDPALGEQIDAAVADGRLQGLHSLLVVRHGRLLLERYYSGPDEDWGAPLGNVDAGPHVLHDMRSISKTVVALLYGIALAEDRVPGLSAVLVDQFPGASDLAREPQRRRITVEHALTMTLGQAWDETLPYTDPANSEIAMERAADRYRFILEQPVTAAPGTRWNYSGGATALVARIVADGTGMALHDYAKERLFAPLGIGVSSWAVGNDGEPAAASGLRLCTPDLARIGELIAKRGDWGGQQIVPAAWLDAMCTPRTPAEDGLWYGYFTWVGHLQRPGDTWVAAFGNGGQRLTVMPSLDLVFAMTAGRYNEPEHWRLPVAVTLEHVMPALRNRHPPVGADGPREG